MSERIDITGKQFGRLVAISETNQYAGRSRKWLCQCDCGNIKVINKYNLVSGHTKSCGCLHKEKASKTGKANIKHGMSQSSTYKSWQSMNQRCANKKHHAYNIYGGRGITVCKRWEKFENFYADMGDRPDGTSLDRIDNSGNYSPENCRWATKKEQSRNRRSNSLLTYNGKTKTISEWSEIKGICWNTIYSRVYELRWPIGKSLNHPVNN